MREVKKRARFVGLFFLLLLLLFFRPIPWIRAPLTRLTEAWWDFHVSIFVAYFHVKKHPSNKTHSLHRGKIYSMIRQSSQKKALIVYQIYPQIAIRALQMQSIWCVSKSVGDDPLCTAWNVNAEFWYIAHLQYVAVKKAYTAYRERLRKKMKRIGEKVANLRRVCVSRMWFFLPSFTVQIVVFKWNEIPI